MICIKCKKDISYLNDAHLDLCSWCLEHEEEE